MSNLVKCRKRNVPSIKFDSNKNFCDSWDIPLDLTEYEIMTECWYPKGRKAYKLPFCLVITKHWRKCLVKCTIVQIYGRMYLAGTVPEVRMKDVLASYNNLVRRMR